MTIRDYIDIVENRLDELFDTEGVTWEDKTHAIFSVGDETFKAAFVRDAGGGNHYDFAFYAEKGLSAPEDDRDAQKAAKYGNTGDVGRASVKVFSYALAALEQFIASYKPYSIAFTGDPNTKRDVLYNRMALALETRIKKLGYHLTIKRGSMSGLLRFSLKREDRVSEDFEEEPEEDYDDDEADEAQPDHGLELHDYGPSEAMALPTFRRWFAGSKVVDTHGPMILYHGRREKWTAMKTGAAEKFRDWLMQANMDKHHAQELAFAERLGDVMWFTDDAGIAHGYRDSDTEGDVLEAYLSIKNPLDLRISAIGVAKLEAILTVIYQTPQKIDLNYSEELGAARAIVYDNSIVMQWARANGHDGVIHDDTDIQGRYTHTSYVVFKPTQIKSCMNTGEFSPADLNIHR